MQAWGKRRYGLGAIAHAAVRENIEAHVKESLDAMVT